MPLDTCGTGTTFDPSTGTCRPNLVCSDGLIAHEDLCRTEAEIAALERDAVEAIVDANDPDLGGVPEPVTLEPLGGRLVFTGTIGRPADMDGDGASDQDKDSWSFDGERRTVLAHPHPERRPAGAGLLAAPARAATSAHRRWAAS